MNQQLVDQMAAMRRDGFTMQAIAEEIGVSERTVRRYVKGVQPGVKPAQAVGPDELADTLFDRILERRRILVEVASEHWGRRSS